MDGDVLFQPSTHDDRGVNYIFPGIHPKNERKLLEEIMQ